MTKRLEIQYVDPGEMAYYTLDCLKRPALQAGADWDAWGVCEEDRYFWLGDRISLRDKDVLRVSLLEVMDKKEAEYPDWGDEEIYLMVGFDPATGAFTWYLLDRNEFRRWQQHFAQQPVIL